MFKTRPVSYSFTFEYLRLSSKHSVALPFYPLSLASSNLKVSILTKTPQHQSCCLDWRASSSRDLNCAWVSHYATELPGGDVPLANTISPAWSRTHAAVLHFLSWITQGVSHFISESELLQDLLSISPSHTELTWNYSFPTSISHYILFRALNKGST